ncbi:acetyl-CoA carboxylase biotin carboxyl carrier protein subunit [Leptospira weilii]|uniref:acetyl-CoA carboxylase biotin carboxyl carrier protein subunit n=1 Tax=Leptospira weilii TaxID=28184 RepID=UPI000774CC58|nr:acetyl-CoA carboxylase biotin carboxyl carrier protein subunit [Leptospira weilii]
MIEENFRFRHGEEEIPVRVRSNSFGGDTSVSIVLNGIVHDFRISRNFQNEGNGLFSDSENHWKILRKGNRIFIHYKGWNTKIVLSNREIHLEEGSGGLIKSPMPGKVIRVLVSPGAAVKKGTVLAIVEAMKMENNILSPGEGTVEEVLTGEGSMVSQDDVILKLNLG